MKRLRPNFLRSKWIFSAGFLTAVAGVFLLVPVPAVHAGETVSLPRWYSSEMDAITLYQSGINQETTNPQGAVKTLQQARLDSTAAITNGGGGNPTVLHNDKLIAQALIAALADETKTPENQNAGENPKSSGNHPARLVGAKMQTRLALR